MRPLLKRYAREMGTGWTPGTAEVPRWPRCTAGRVVTAGSSDNGWLGLQHDLATLSTNSVHRSVLTRPILSLVTDQGVPCA